MGGVSQERPGGNAINIGDSKYRIVQDCSRMYGEKLKIYHIEKIDITNGIYREKLYEEIEAKALERDSKINFRRIHTLTRSGHFEAVDFYYDRFYLLKPLRLIKGLRE